MTEIGSDAQLAARSLPHEVSRPVVAERQSHDREEWRVRAAAPAVMEPGDDFPDPDEIPPGDPPDYNPMPPEVPA
jgi:hypothetical protein